MADTFAWILMPNHFHLLVRIKEDMVYEYSKEDFNNANAVGPHTTNPHAGADGLANIGGPANKIISFDDVKRKKVKRKSANPTRHFGHLCNAYAKYINDKYQRHGSLFQRPFRRSR